MTKLTHGPVTITFDDSLALPANAGKLTPDEIARLPKAPNGIVFAAEQTAQAMTDAGTAFTPPQGITAKTLLAASHRAEGYDSLILAVDVLRGTLQQANLLADAECWNQLRQVNDMVKGQVKHHPELAAMFAPLSHFVARPGRGGKKADAASPTQA